MMNFIRFLTFLFCFPLFNSCEAGAGFFRYQKKEALEICWMSFKDPLPLEKGVYRDWPKAGDSKAPLSEDVRRRILSHPKVKELRAFYQKGKALIFDFEWLGEESSHKGEHIQRAFLIQVLQFLFPKAKIVIRGYKNRFAKTHPPSSSSKIHIPLEVKDVQESGKFVSEGELERFLSLHKNIVDMVLLKQANSSQKALPKDYKNSFPSFEKNTVLSLYISEGHLNYSRKLTEEDLGDSPDLFQILDEFLDLGFRKVFLTSHFQVMLSKEEKDRFLSSLSDRFDQILFLSQISQDRLFQIPDRDKVLFFNDLRGRTAVLHSLADLAFVFGPINMLEGIFLDAKVIFSSRIESWDRSQKYHLAFETLKQTALRTNRAVYIERLERLEKALQTLDQLALEPVVYPDEVVVREEKGDALKRLLDRLYFQITENAFLQGHKI